MGYCVELPLNKWIKETLWNGSPQNCLRSSSGKQVCWGIDYIISVFLRFKKHLQNVPNPKLISLTFLGNLPWLSRSGGTLAFLNTCKAISCCKMIGLVVNNTTSHQTLCYRVEHVLSSISRPPEEIARYTMIKHEKRKPLAWKVRVKLLRTSWRRYRLDGLNTASYTLIALEEHTMYTRLLVDVGHPPHNIKVLQQQQDSNDRRTTPPTGA